MQTLNHATSNNGAQAPLVGEFLSKLSPQAMSDFESMIFPSAFPANMLVFSEGDQGPGVQVVLEGEVRLSMSSSDGRRLALSIARKGSILGLVSTLSGNVCEMTAETLHPAKIATISRRDFLAFLGRHPEAYVAVTQELSRQMEIACMQLRTVALSNSAPEKLARLLLDWSQNGQSTTAGTRFRMSLTHEQIGEFIGISRETVTRTFAVFKSRRLIAFQGSTLTIPSKDALEHYVCC